MMATVTSLLWIPVLGLVALCVTIFAAVKRRKTLALIGGFTLVALSLTILSGAYQRMGPDTGVYGNHCGANYDELCEGLVLTAGFPLSYLIDNPCCSVRYQLHIILEDEFRGGIFMLDTAFYAVALWAGYVLLMHLRKRPHLSAEFQSSPH